MFGRGKQPQFEITEHPDVIAALNAMWQQAYDAGRRDAFAIAQDFREEIVDCWQGSYLDGVDEVIEKLEA